MEYLMSKDYSAVQGMVADMSWWQACFYRACIFGLASAAGDGT